MAAVVAWAHTCQSPFIRRGTPIYYEMLQCVLYVDGYFCDVIYHYICLWTLYRCIVGSVDHGTIKQLMVGVSTQLRG